MDALPLTELDNRPLTQGKDFFATYFIPSMNLSEHRS